MAELMFGLSQTKKKKNEEQKVRTTKQSLKDVNITDTIEKEVRKEHHQRDQTWKKTGRDQIKSNTNFDMARSLFGGSGAAPAAVETEDDDDLEEPTEQLRGIQLDDHKPELDAARGEYEEEEDEEHDEYPAADEEEEDDEE